MINRLCTAISRIKDIYQKEGFLTTIKRIFVLAMSWISHENSVFYVYLKPTKESKEADRMPRIQNLYHRIVRIVETVQQLDELSDEGFDLSLLDIDQARYRRERSNTLFTFRWS